MHGRHTPSRRPLVAITVACLVAVLAPATRVIAAGPIDVVFNPVDAEQQWTVPAGVTSIHVELIGAKGAGGGGFAGGLGHNVSGDLAVSPGLVLYVEVGGDGLGRFGGFNGGGLAGSAPVASAGGGGGASDIRTISRTESELTSLESRLMVAGGGGGVGNQTTGGDAGADGAGGTLGGLAGTTSSGGAGGQGDREGASGRLGIGGDSADWCTFDVCSSGTAGGGGGGGYYGGGGGGGASADLGIGPSGSGGGGSAYTGAATNPSVSIETELDASITITYTPGGADPTSGPDTGVVDAEVTVPTSAACIELSATSISFGTQRFGTEDVLAAPGITVTNCSGVEEALLARGTDATGSGAAWQLVDNTATCGGGTLATDDFHLKIRRPANEADPVTQLSKDNKQIAELGAGDAADLEALLDMPCPGSSGAGQTMGMQIVFLVTEL